MKLREAFTNRSSADIKFSKIKTSKIMQFGELLGALLRKIAGPLIKFALSLNKNTFLSLDLKVAESAVDAGIRKKTQDLGNYGSGTIT